MRRKDTTKTFRTEAADSERWDQLAARNGVGFSELVREALDYYEQHGPKTEAA